MQYNRTYLDKCATIVNGSEYNTGLNPVSELVYGRNLSRLLVHFDESKLRKMYKEKVYPDISKLHHILKMTNAGSLDMSELHKVYNSQIDGETKKRTSSFDLIFFLIPKFWDGGKGFDYTTNFMNTDYYDKASYDSSLYKLTDGVNWYKPRNGYTWYTPIDYVHTKAELLDFYIKSDIVELPATGGTVIFTYRCECNGNNINYGLTFDEVGKSLDSKLEFSTPVCFGKNGQICHTDYSKQKHCAYIQQMVTIPATTSKKKKNVSFVVKYTIDGKVYKSNPYYIKQLGTEEEAYPTTTDGVYSTRTLEKELYKFNNGGDSIVIAKQHFDVGDENISVDISDTVNKFILGELNNYGIGIAFAPDFEYEDSTIEQYIGILTNKTNSFFEPYLETIYDDPIRDDRANFILGKNNRLYLYSNIGGNLENLDEMPICTVEGKEFEVKQATKGVYYIEITIPIEGNGNPTMFYDTWSNIKYKGSELPDIELDFTTQSPYSFFNLGNSIPEKEDFSPSIYGINDNEIIKRGDLRKLGIVIRKKYTVNKGVNIDRVKVRLYVMDGTAQTDVIPYMEANKAFTENYVMIDTSILIPQMYYVDVKVEYGMESIVHHDVLHFKVVDDINNKYE
jgi:hypothetical protein